MSRQIHFIIQNNKKDTVFTNSDSEHWFGLNIAYPVFKPAELSQYNI